VTTAHEPRRGPGVHLSVDDLSALAEGAQPTAEGASEHLLDCAACREEVDAIGQLLAAFETLEPPQLPQDVAIRIDAALAREAAARASSPNADAAAASASAGRAASGRRRWRPSLRFGAGLASLAALVGGLALAINLVSSSNTQTGGAASGAAAKPDAATTSGPMRAQGEANAPNKLAPTSPLAIWVKQALSGTRPDVELNSPCLADPAFSGEQTLRVVVGTYQGVPATLVVYANGSDAKTVRAVVYAQPCATSRFQVLAQGIAAK
jgi:hypothetical protein